MLPYMAKLSRGKTLLQMVIHWKPSAAGSLQTYIADQQDHNLWKMIHDQVENRENFERFLLEIFAIYGI